MHNAKPHFLAAVVILATLVGCATQHEVVIAKFDQTAPMLPTVSLFRGERDATREECDKVNDNLMKQCQFDIVDLPRLQRAFARTGRFDSVRVAREDPALKLYITQIYFNEESAGDLVRAAWSGATLLLAPHNSDSRLLVASRVELDGQTLDTLLYELPFSTSASWYENEDINDLLADSIASHVVRDIQNKNLLPQGGAGDTP